MFTSFLKVNMRAARMFDENQPRKCYAKMLNTPIIIVDPRHYVPCNVYAATRYVVTYLVFLSVVAEAHVRRVQSVLLRRALHADLDLVLE